MSCISHIVGYAQVQPWLEALSGPLTSALHQGDTKGWRTHQVLILLDTSSSKLLAMWQGPFEVTKKVGDFNYEVSWMKRGRSQGIYHINLLTPWRKVAPVALVTIVTEREELGKWIPILSSSLWRPPLSIPNQRLPSCKWKVLTSSHHYLVTLSDRTPHSMRLLQRTTMEYV